MKTNMSLSDCLAYRQYDYLKTYNTRLNVRLPERLESFLQHLRRPQPFLVQSQQHLPQALHTVQTALFPDKKKHKKHL